jgi:2-dehydro-3-deoxyphosphogluconate aldolase / (4S)-4-hydroxy-2-oxoglutarate aldolase
MHRAAWPDKLQHMGIFSKKQIITAMKDTGMIPVFFNADVDIATGVLDAAYRGGVRVFEFTNRGGNAYEVFCTLVNHIDRYPDLMLGIGTIMDGATAQKFIDAGAHFIVSPVLKPEMAPVCAKSERPWIPGCGTLTEIVTAKELGAEIVKLFPGSVLGPGFVSAVMPVVPGLQLMPTGGVEPTEQNLSAWFRAGVACVGMGSQLITKDILEKKDWPALEAKVREAMALLAKIRTRK